MNGIYDFENYHTPYLDVEMLMKRKAEKRARRILVLSGIATMLMSVLMIMMLYLCATMSKNLFVILCSLLSVYIIVGALLIGIFMKRKGVHV